MSAPVHILATCRSPELLRATTLVFDTLRVGFPTAAVSVYYNGTEDSPEKDQVRAAALRSGALWQLVPSTIHHEWIEMLLEESEEPFWICDTDLAFWGIVEGFDFSHATLAGRFVPRFFDKFTNCISLPRLHTSLLYINPRRVKEAAAAYLRQFPQTPFNPPPNLLYPCFYPQRVGSRVVNYFHDTCSLLYHALGGTPFTTAQNEQFDHLNFGTISDVVAPYYPEYKWRDKHFAVFENPQLLKGAWKTDEQFYLQNPG